MLAADVEKYKEAHRERIQAKAETQDTASLARLLLPGGVLSHEVPTAEQALLNRTAPTQERPQGLPAAADARRWAMAAWLSWVSGHSGLELRAAGSASASLEALLP